MAAQTTADFTRDFTPADAVREAALAGFDALLSAVQGAAEDAADADAESADLEARIARQGETIVEYRLRINDQHREIERLRAALRDPEAIHWGDEAPAHGG